MQRTKDTNVLRGLQYFEAVARHRSLKLAATDLGVTESAVSHRMRRFSEAVGHQLLIKSGRGIAFTAAGEELAAKLVSAFAGLDSLVKELVGGGRQMLQLAVCSSFGPGWLVGRLEGFFEAHPQIDLRLRLYAQDPALTGEVTDAFVTAHPVNEDYARIRLFDEMLVAVHAPNGPRAGKRGLRHSLITTDVQTGHVGQDWIDFCKKAGIKLADLQVGPFRQCTHYLLALEVARSGHGMALVPNFLAAKDIGSGALVPLSPVLLPSKRVYHLCFKKSRSHEPKLAALAKWFKAQIAERAASPNLEAAKIKSASANRRKPRGATTCSTAE